MAECAIASPCTIIPLNVVAAQAICARQRAPAPCKSGCSFLFDDARSCFQDRIVPPCQLECIMAIQTTCARTYSQFTICV